MPRKTTLTVREETILNRASVEADSEMLFEDDDFIDEIV
jgi:hypothetical protein